MSYDYLGSPYSKFAEGLDAAFDEIAWVSGQFAKAGIPAYSPIILGHAAAKAAKLDPLDYKIWLPFVEPLMTGARRMIVVKMEGWEESFGLRQEIAYFGSARKPVRYLDPVLMILDDGLPLSSLVAPERIAA